MSTRDLKLLTFPTDYPLKVVVRQHPAARAAIDAIVRRHTPDLTDGAISVRDSRAGNFVSITYAIVARDADHVVTLITELRASEFVLMVI